MISKPASQEAGFLFLAAAMHVSVPWQTPIRPSVLCGAHRE
jgi:hypothetical protein